MKPAEILKQEHETILLALRGTDAALKDTSDPRNPGAKGNPA